MLKGSSFKCKVNMLAVSPGFAAALGNETFGLMPGMQAMPKVFFIGSGLRI